MSHALVPPAPRLVPVVPAATAWHAVATRDPAYDGRFVYAVRTTGVFCRPSCGSRRPRRENVEFFSDAGAAERAGFRACRRCRPTAAVQDAPLVDRARQWLDSHAEETVTLADLAARVGASPWHLQRAFTKATGVSPREYQLARRADRLRSELRRGRTVTRATYEAGFGSGSRVYESADATLGMTPGAYRRGGAGLVVGFTTVATRLGRLLVATTERGVCAVALGDSDAALEQRLRADLPRAEIVRGTLGDTGWIEQVVTAVESQVPARTLPLDVQGTAFQWRVWQALRKIPRGETRSYAEIARAIGSPTAARAVARACASNRVAVVIPCHRVVREDGELGGYRWGITRKERLLEAERG